MAYYYKLPSGSYLQFDDDTPRDQALGYVSQQLMDQYFPQPQEPAQPPEQPKRTFWGNVGETLKGLPYGAAEGTLQTGIGLMGMLNSIGQQIDPVGHYGVSDDPKIQALQDARKWMQDSWLAPKAGYETSFGRELGQGIGSLAPIVAGSMLGGIPGLAAATGMGVGMSAADTMDRIQAAKDAGTYQGTDAGDANATLLGGATGLLYGLPVMRAMKLAKFAPLGDALKPLANVPIVGAILRGLGKEAPDTLKEVVGRTLYNAAATGGINGVQMAGQGVLQDLIARGYYNPDQPVGESFWHDLGFGTVMGAAFGLAHSVPGAANRMIDINRNRIEGAQDKAIENAFAADRQADQTAQYQAALERFMQEQNAGNNTLALPPPDKQLALPPPDIRTRNGAPLPGEQMPGDLPDAVKLRLANVDVEGPRKIEPFQDGYAVLDENGKPMTDVVKDPTDLVEHANAINNGEIANWNRGLEQWRAEAPQQPSLDIPEIPPRPVPPVEPATPNTRPIAAEDRVSLPDGSSLAYGIEAARTKADEKQRYAIVRNSFDPQGNLLSSAPVEVHPSLEVANRRLDELYGREPQPAQSATTAGAAPAAAKPEEAPGTLTKEIKPALDHQPTQQELADLVQKATAQQTPEIAKTPQEQYREFVQPIGEALRKRLSGYGLGDVKLKLSSMLRHPGVDGTTLELEGMYHPLQRVMRLATDLDPKLPQAEFTNRLGRVLDHEAVHALKRMNLFKPEEWSVLENYVRRRRRAGDEQGRTFYQEAADRYTKGQGLPEDKLVEEAVADAFRYWAMAPNQVDAKPRGLLRRIFDFFKRAAGVKRDLGTEADRIFTAMQRGEVGNRPRGELASAEPATRMSIRARPKRERGTWYSPVERHVAQMPVKDDKPRSGEQWLADIKRGKDVKPAEMKWLGLDEFLKGKKNVTKKDVLEYVRDNQVEVRETNYPGDDGPARYEQYRAIPHDERYGADALPDTYRELTLAIEPHEGTYGSPHWDEPNVVAHIRFDDRFSPDGKKKIMLLQEMQSDWASAQRRRGDMPIEQVRALAERHYKELTMAQNHALKLADDLEQYLADRDPALSRITQETIFQMTEDWIDSHGPDVADGLVSPAEWARSGLAQHSEYGQSYVKLFKADPVLSKKMLDYMEQMGIAERARALSDRYHSMLDDNAPDQPWGQDWYKPTFRRAVQYAAEHGYDQIAWAPGDAHAKLWMKEPEGYRSLYDQKLKSYADKWGKEFGTGVREGNLSQSGDQAGRVWIMDLPDAMRNKTSNEGIPLFSIKNLTAEQAEPTRENLGRRLAPTTPDAIEQASNNGIRDWTDSMLGRWWDKHRDSKTMQALRDKHGGKFERFQTFFQDNMAPVNRVVRDVVRSYERSGMTPQEANGMVPNYMRPWMQEQLFHGRTGTRIEDAEKNMFEPLLKKLGEMSSKEGGITKDELEYFLMARHAPERNKYLREKFAADTGANDANAVARMKEMGFGQDAIDREMAKKAKRRESPSGISDQDAADYMKSLAEKRPERLKELQDLAAMNDAIVKSTQRLRREYGLDPVWDPNDPNIPHYKHYVPLRGFWDEDPTLKQKETFAKTGRGYSISGREDKKALGRSSLATDVLAHTMLQHVETIVRGEKNKVGQSFLALVRKYGSPEGFAHVEDVAPTMESQRRTGEIDENGMDIFTRQKIREPWYKTDPNILTVKEGGKDVLIRMNDDAVARSMNRLYQTGAEPTRALVNALQKVNVVLARLSTSLNPEFIAANFLKDSQHAALLAQQYGLKNVAGSMLKNVKGSISAIMDFERGRNLDSPDVRLYREMREHGGTTSFLGIQTLEDQIKRADKIARTAQPQTLGAARDMIKKVGSLIETSNNVAENATRFNIYKIAREQGLSPEDAAFIAKNITVNFNKGGEAKVLMNALYLFYNASLQGSMSLTRGLIYSPKIRKLAAGVILAGVANDLLNYFASDNDETGRNAYDNLLDGKDWEANNNIILPTFGVLGKNYIKIPMPYGFNALFGMGRNISRVMRGSLQPFDAAGKSFMGMVDAFNPIGGTERFANFVMPTILDPFVDTFTNRDFANRPIKPEPMDYHGVKKPQNQLYWNNTSPLSIGIAQWLNKITGGNDFLPGSIDMSPAVIDYWAGYFTGAVGKFAERAMAAPFKIASGDFQDVDANDIIFVRRLVGTAGNRVNQERYYQVVKDVLEKQQAVKNALKAGNADEANEMRAEYGGRLAIAPAVLRVDTEIGHLRSMVHKVQADTHLDDKTRQERVDQLRKRIDDLTIQTLRLYNERVPQ